MSYNVLLTGTTGMVGKGVLLECLDSQFIKSVTVINRSSLNLSHPKLKEILLKDFMQLDTIKDQLQGIDGCFHCMGVSVVGLSEEQYTYITFEMTKKLADIMYELNPNCVFDYVSGQGTDSSEKGRTMWARVKGRTENYILNRGFRQAFMFRPGAIIPEKGIKTKTPMYNLFYVLASPFYPLLRKSKNITTSSKLGLAMIDTLMCPPAMQYLGNREINELAAE